MVTFEKTYGAFGFWFDYDPDVIEDIKANGARWIKPPGFWAIPAHKNNTKDFKRLLSDHGFSLDVMAKRRLRSLLKDT